MFHEACPEQSRSAQHDNASYKTVPGGTPLAAIAHS
jgi:hypothetical protein